MNEIDLGNEIVYTVKIGSQSFEMREPSALEIEEFKRSVDAQGESTITPAIELVVKLGLPKENAEKLGLQKLNKLLEGLTGDLQKK